MEISGKKTTVTRWLHANGVALRVEVEAIIPDADSSEVCLMPTTLRYLDDLQALVNAGEIETLREHGEVFIRQSA